MKTKEKVPAIIFENGRPAGVILNIEKYRQMLERLEDLEDLRLLEEMRKKPLRFKKLDDFLKEFA